MKFSGMMLLAASLLQTPSAGAQSGDPARFDVASVKVSDKPYLMIAPARAGGRIQWTTDLGHVLGYAFQMQPWQISGPVPGSTSIYEFDLATNAAATEDQVRQMFQDLLADRFKMVSRRVTKEVLGYALTVARGGPKMDQATEGKMPPLPEWFRAPSGDLQRMEGRVVATLPRAGTGNLVGRRVTMEQLSQSIQRQVGTVVFDHTGLTGKYYFAIEYATEDAPPEVTLPNLFAALKDLGIQVVKEKGPAETLVVDRIDKTPTGN